MTAVQLFTRSEHGGLPVVVHDEGRKFDLDLPGGERSFTSSRQLMAVLHGGRDPHLPWRRYFKVGPYADPLPTPLESVFDLWGRDGDMTVDDGGGPRVVGDARLTDDPGSSPVELQGAPGSSLGASVRISVGSTTLGIDLENRAHEVAKLFYAGFGRRCFTQGYDTEEVLQEVYKGLLARNAGSCPYDPRKSSFGHYVHMVCSCILSNYHRKERRRRAREQVGVRAFLEDGRWANMDTRDALARSSVSNCSGASARTDAAFYDFEMRQAEEALADHLSRSVPGVSAEGVQYALAVLPFKAAGCTRREIVGHTGLKPAHVEKGVKLLQRAARSWLS
jgi:hypothetical protein